MKRSLFAAAIAAATVILAGCGTSTSTGGSGGGGGGPANAQRLRQRYTQLARAVQDERIDAAMRVISPDYLDSGLTYVDWRNAFAQSFDIYDNIQDFYSFDSIQVNGQFATVLGTETFSGNNTWKTGSPRETLQTNFRDVWRYEFGDWYLYGDQTGAGVARKALRYSPEHLKNAVTVTK